MRSVLILAAALVFAHSTNCFAAGANHDAPLNQCTGAPCTTQQAAIWNQFLTGTPLTSDVVGHVYSGSCYHRTSQLNANTEHFAVLYFDTLAGQIYMSGKFAFYYKENPYTHWNAADAVQQLAPEHNDLEIVHFEKDYAWVDENHKPPPIMQYYLRKNEGKLMLYGFWSVDWNLFCELTPNP